MHTHLITGGVAAFRIKSIIFSGRQHTPVGCAVVRIMEGFHNLSVTIVNVEQTGNVLASTFPSVGTQHPFSMLRDCIV